MYGIFCNCDNLLAFRIPKAPGPNKKDYIWVTEMLFQSGSLGKEKGKRIGGFFGPTRTIICSECKEDVGYYLPELKMYGLHKQNTN